MGTKRNPGPNDCYEKAGLDEPIFVLRAKDFHAPHLIEIWASLQLKKDSAKVREALRCAEDMRNWRIIHGG